MNNNQKDNNLFGNKFYKKTKQIGQIIKQERKKQKINGSDFSKKIGISRSTLQKIEAGYVNISIYDYLNAADHLSLDICFVIEDKYNE